MFQREGGAFAKALGWKEHGVFDRWRGGQCGLNEENGGREGWR